MNIGIGEYITMNGREMLEKYLIVHCSPTLASLKTANLFNCRYKNVKILDESMEYWKKELQGKGLQLVVLQKLEERALIYIYRTNKLQEDLEKPGVMELLRKYGYENANPVDAIEHLKERLGDSEDFPHEIGLFLGYPLEDVVGFIMNEGKNCHCLGCWKVYCNKEEAERTFCKYQKCREVYIRLWKNGRSVSQLTVAA